MEFYENFQSINKLITGKLFGIIKSIIILI